MTELVVNSLINSGPLGIVLLVMMYFVWKQWSRGNEVTDKIINVVESNTKAMTKLDESVEHLAEAQNKRRRDFGKG